MSESPPARILVVDDEPLFLTTTVQLLRKAGYECASANSGESALRALSERPFDLVLSDLNMPGNFELELLNEGRRKWPAIPLIVVTGAPSLPTAIESVRLGIADYLLKPVKYEDLISSIRRALKHAQRQSIEAERPAGKTGFPEIIGESAPMRELFEIIERVAVTDTNILITGESGTGKEVVARAIHHRSRRAAGALQVIDCTAIPETLFESIVFGHAKGAFTGAIKDQVGLLTVADGGSAFFDEIGELPLPLQAKLLRVIQEQTFIPVGKTSPETIDVRFICATNRDLELEVNAGRFRRDLFYRLAVIHIEMPPLHQRGDDVILLARHFLRQLRPERSRVQGFAADTLDLLRRYRWPGNIRELRNAVEHGLAVARSEEILPADLPKTLLRPSSVDPSKESANPPASSRAQVLDDAERDYLIDLLRNHAGNVAQSARDAGMSRQGLHKLLQKHGIDASEYRS